MQRIETKALGFTLMEMLVALMVGAIVITPLYFVTRGMAQGSENRRQDTEATQRARVGMDYLMRDFRRAGLSVCPVTGVNSSTGLGVDPLCDNRNISNSNAKYRKAVVHLNRGVGGFDAVLLSGNFLSGAGTTHVGFSTDYGVFDLSTPVSQEECLEQFNSGYSFAHIIGQTNRYLDARIGTTATYNSGTGLCTGIGVLNDDISNNNVFSSVESVLITTNQTALYMVERVSTPEGPRNDLVRYFVDYDNTSATTTCELDGATSVADVTLPGDSTPIIATRMVIAQYVEDFQVWFRPVTVVDQQIIPNNHQPVDGAGVTGASASGGVFEDGFALPDAQYIFPSSNAAPVAGNQHLSCDQPINSKIGPEQLRSVLIRLAVRTERTDPTLPFASYGGANHMVRHSLVRYGGAGDSGAAETDLKGASFRLKTMLTEVPLFNLSAKTKLIPGLADSRRQAGW